MLKLLCVSALAAVSFATTSSAEKPTLPAPPSGFVWTWQEDAGIALLKPKTWHFVHRTSNDTWACFITREQFNEKSEFSTGLTVNILPEVGLKNGGTASDFALAFVREAISARGKVLKVIRPGALGPAKTFGCRIRRDSSIIHYFLIADDAHDKLYLLFFESPEKEWEESWKTGEQIMKKIYVDIPDD